MGYFLLLLFKMYFECIFLEALSFSMFKYPLYAEIPIIKDMYVFYLEIAVLFIQIGYTRV